MTAPAATTTTWTVDASHSLVEFSVKHMMITTVKGRFAAFTGTVTIPEGDLLNAQVSLEIDATSIDTRDEKRDGHLKSGDFFNCEQFPTIAFASTGVTRSGDDYLLAGNLTMHGVTKPVTLTVTDEGEGKDPWGGTRRAFAATAKLDRREFGLEWNAALEAGGVLVSNEVKLNFELQLVQQN